MTEDGSTSASQYVDAVLFEEAPGSPDHEIVEIPWMVVPLVLTALASLLLGMFPDPVLKLARSVSP